MRNYHSFFFSETSSSIIPFIDSDLFIGKNLESFYFIDLSMNFSNLL